MLGWLGDLLGLNQGDPTIDAANRNRDVISGYNTTANNLIDLGANKAGGYLQQISDLFSPLASEGQKAGLLYSDALGVNGPEGTTRAQDAFTASPGYQFALDQGLQALDRTAASRGMLGSGNTSADTLKFATGLAGQDFGSWLDRLGSPGTLIGGALGNETSALNNLANLATGTATAKTGIAGDVASAYTGANNQQASGETANKQGLAGLGSALMGNLGSFMGYGGFGNSLEGSLVNGIKGLF